MEGDGGLAQRIPARLTSAEGRKFAFTVGSAFLAMAGLTWWRSHSVAASVLGFLGAGLWLSGAAVPERLGPIFRAWMALAHAISRITTPIFMGIVYFGILAPIGLLMRVFGRNPVRHRAVGGSYWQSRDQARGGLNNQF
jgi:hypothetical protein